MITKEAGGTKLQQKSFQDERVAVLVEEVADTTFNAISVRASDQNHYFVHSPFLVEHPLPTDLLILQAADTLCGCGCGCHLWEIVEESNV